MQIKETGIDGLKLLFPNIYHDHRGWFMEVFKASELSKIDFHLPFVQENISFSKKSVLRGLHFQQSPYGQAKLVMAITGKIQDVVVDLRENSKTFLKTFTCILQGDQPSALLIPEGFAHGFLALEDSHFYYKCTNHYHPTHEAGIMWNDKKLNIEWENTTPVLSEKDQHLLSIDEFLRKSVISRKY